MIWPVVRKTHTLMLRGMVAGIGFRVYYIVIVMVRQLLLDCRTTLEGVNMRHLIQVISLV
jgi:hypothetical protein